MFLKRRAMVHSTDRKVKERKTCRNSASARGRAVRGGGVMAFAATFTAVTWIGGGVLLHGLVQDLRAEQARLANVATACPSEPLVAQGPARAAIGMSDTLVPTNETTPRQGRSPLFAQVFGD